MSVSIIEYLRHILDEVNYLMENAFGMRDKLIHDYFGIDYELVADVLNNRIPDLKIQVEEIIRKESVA